MKRSRIGPHPSRIDRDRIIEDLEAAVRHSPGQEAESAAWGVSPIETYLKDRLDFVGLTSDE
jgi:hypothetical protein